MKSLKFILIMIFILTAAPAFADVYWVDESPLTPVQGYDIQWSVPFGFGNGAVLYNAMPSSPIMGTTLSHSYQYPQNSYYQRTCSPNWNSGSNYRQTNGSRRCQNVNPYYSPRACATNPQRNCYNREQVQYSNNTNYYSQPQYTYDNFTSYKPQNGQSCRSYQPFQYGTPLTAQDFANMYPDRFKQPETNANAENTKTVENGIPGLTEWSENGETPGNVQWVEDKTKQNEEQVKEQKHKEKRKEGEQKK